MRELKFRAWDLDEKKYHYEICLKPLSDVIAIEIYDGEMLPIRTRCLVEQYTGLKDKNGKEIYEGDVVDVWIGGCKQDTPYVVEDMRELYSEFHHDDGYYQFSKVEIIGNIHENPELVKEKE